MRTALATLVLLIFASDLCFTQEEAAKYDLLDPAGMVLAVCDNGTRFSWPLEYGQARQRAIAFLEAGKPEEALRAAKAQFLLCPLDEISIEAAVMSVSEVLVSLDGNDERARAFGKFARFGPAGIDGQAGTNDDLTNPLVNVSPQFPQSGLTEYANIDATMDTRTALGGEWQAHWYETQKAFGRLNGGDLEEALSILVPLLLDSAKYPAGNSEENWELQSNQDILDRINAGLGVIYRAKYGTVFGVDDFRQKCLDYARYGPPGLDDRMGTEDDLAAPI